MEFEWSEAKRAMVLEARNLDFIDGQELFDGRLVRVYPSPREDEERWVTIGQLNEEIIAVVWTKRGDNVRIITMRRARDEEERRYRQLLS